VRILSRGQYSNSAVGSPGSRFCRFVLGVCRGRLTFTRHRIMHRIHTQITIEWSDHEFMCEPTSLTDCPNFAFSP
jgi:hypothetical protein